MDQNENQVGISVFKATCISLLAKVMRSGTPLVVTRRGVPIASIIPYNKILPKRPLGSLRGSLTVLGDIVNFDSSKDWDALR